MAEAANARSAGSALLREGVALTALVAVMLGGARLSSWLAGLAGLATSRDLIFEGEWRPELVDFPWVDCAAMLVLMTALPLIWEAVRGVGPRAIGFRVGTRPFLIGAVLAPALAVFALRTGFVRIDMEAGRTMPLLAYLLVVAVAEETAFRGVIQRRVCQIGGRPVGLIAASLTFTLWHGLDASALVFAERMAGGLVFGLLYMWTKSLAAPVVWHWLLDVALTL